MPMTCVHLVFDWAIETDSSLRLYRWGLVTGSTSWVAHAFTIRQLSV